MGWTARTLAKQLELPPSTLSHWITTGLVEPEERGRGRRGHNIGVSGLLELVAVSQLREAGIPVPSIRQVIENLRSLTGHERPLATVLLVVVGNDVIVEDVIDPSLLTSVLQRPTQRVMVFPIGEQHAQLLDELRETERPAEVPAPHKRKRNKIRETHAA